jgi:UDP-N-acetylmuramoylalanine--D-glutamate ligase
MSAWTGRHVAVWGAARSGIAAANLLADLGAHVVLSDLREAPEAQGLDPRVTLLGGGNVLGEATVLVPSPGIKPSTPALLAARAAGVQILSEIELAGSVCTAPIVAISGTDGKSTTTEMVGAVIRGAGRPALVAGNIGIPFSERARALGPEGVLVVEVSEFQLWSCAHFRPQVSIITNVADDHADYFDHQPERCAAAIGRVLMDQRAGDTAILRAQDPQVAAFVVPDGVETHWFSPAPSHTGWGLTDEAITLDGAPVMARSAMPLPGWHNALNAMAALAAGTALGLPLAPMVEALEAFTGLPHRLQPLGTLNGATWYDDSKATNAHAASVGLRALTVPQVVITGGYDKGLDLQGFADAVAERAHHVVLTGPTADRMAEALAKRVPISRACSMAEAADHAAAMARPGDAVILSPASSSFDAYRNYVHRGLVFQAEAQRVGVA